MSWFGSKSENADREIMQRNVERLTKDTELRKKQLAEMMMALPPLSQQGNTLRVPRVNGTQWVRMDGTRTTTTIDGSELGPLPLAYRTEFMSPIPTKPADPVAEMLAVEDVPDEYFELLKRIGSESNAAALDVALRRFFQREEIPVYPYKKVSAFMDWHVTQERVKQRERYIEWYWAPLRPQDGKVRRTPLYDRGFAFDSSPESAYSQAIPMSALRLVDRMLSKFPTPDQLHFFVSDYAVVKPDPFLMVKTKTGEQYVIHHWDEPMFHPDVLK